MKKIILFLLAFAAIFSLTNIKKEIYAYAYKNPETTIFLLENSPRLFTETGIDYMVAEINPHFTDFESMLWLPHNTLVGLSQDSSFQGETQTTCAKFARKNPKKIIALIKEHNEYAWAKIKHVHGEATATQLNNNLISIDKLLQILDSASNSELSELTYAAGEMEKYQQRYYNDTTDSRSVENKYRKSIAKFCKKLRNAGIDVPSYDAMGMESITLNIYIPRLICRSSKSFSGIRETIKTAREMIAAAKRK